MMNDRRPKREEIDDSVRMDFELRAHRVERRKKATLNSPTAQPADRRPSKDIGREQLRCVLNRNPYANAMYESTGCKLHPQGPVNPGGGHFVLLNPYSANKFNNQRYESEARLPSFCNDSYLAKCNGLGLPSAPPTPPPPPTSLGVLPPPLSPFSHPSSPRVYYHNHHHHRQQLPFALRQRQLSPIPSPSPPPSVTAGPPSSASGSDTPTAGSIAGDPLPGLQPRIVRPTSQGTVPSDINRNPPPPSTTSQSQKITEFSIVLKNNVVVCLEVEDATGATCHDLIALMAEEPQVGIPHEAEDLFSLWLISPIFEVQLKPDHKPLLMYRKWQELLAKYTTANAAQKDKDFPFLCLQRDVFFPKKDEARLATGCVLELLYEEAKGNIISGRYPCDQSSSERLAGIQARIELGKFDADIHSPAFFKARLENFLPPSACKSKWSLFQLGSKSGVEYRLLLSFRGLQDDVSRQAIMRQYLEYCWTLPSYGSAFFAGQLEKPAHGLAALIGYHDTPVLVAINSEGVTITSPTQGVLLGLKYQELSWDSARPAQENNPDCFPCLFLQFQVLELGQRVFKVLQVFSKQAILMDAIISSFVRALRRRSWDRDEADDSTATTPGDCTPDADDAQTPLTTSSLYGSTSNNDSETAVTSKLQRLSLATFNEDGDCIGLMGSWAFR